MHALSRKPSSTAHLQHLFSEAARPGRQDAGGLLAHHYHAGMSATQRVAVQNRWRAGDLQARPGGPAQRVAAPAPALRRARPRQAGPRALSPTPQNIERWLPRPSYDAQKPALLLG